MAHPAIPRPTTGLQSCTEPCATNTQGSQSITSSSSSSLGAIGFFLTDPTRGSTMISDLRALSTKTSAQESMTNNIDCLENQQCRVCDEKAAGFHFGAFTCEGCKSFFGRFCNNQTVIPDCKNNYVCVIDKRNRTSCKACRLKKCLSVGMSKSGCRYGRRSNWFKIHCLMQKNNQKTAPAQILPSPHLPSPPLPTPSSTTFPPFPRTLPQSSPYTKPLKISSSRSPSPLNISSESGPSPPSSSLSFPHPPTQPHLPPIFDPLSIYRLSPLFALSPLLQHSPSPLLTQFSDFKHQLDILAERRLLFERLQKEAICSSPSSSPSASPNSSIPPFTPSPPTSSYPTSSSPGPVDLSVK